MSLITEKMAVALDETLSGVDAVQWSEDGSSESSNVSSTSVSLTSATDDDPSVKENDSQIISDGASSSCTITHFAFAANGDRVTTWNELENSKELDAGDKLVADAGELQEKFHQATSAP